jgi:hypothetical protein
MCYGLRMVAVMTDGRKYKEMDDADGEAKPKAKDEKLKEDEKKELWAYRISFRKVVIFD